MVARLAAIVVLTLACAGSAIETVHAQARTRIAGGPSLPADCAPRELFALTSGDVGTYECIATNSWRKIHGGVGEAQLSVTDYGAVCDGATDDSVGLQAAFDAATAFPAATVLLPPRTCSFGTPLIVGSAVGSSYQKLNIVGQSEDASILAYTGLDSGSTVAMHFKHVGFFKAESFALSGPVNTKTHAGSTIGILLGRDTGTGGTQTVAGSFVHVAISGFAYGMIAGDTDAASEIECRNCRFSWNNVGFTSSGFNSLNFWFYNVDLSSNAHGMEMGNSQVSDGFKVIGGATALNDVDFYLGNTFGTALIQGIRSEQAGLFIQGGSPMLRVDSCIVKDSVNANDRLIDTSGGKVEIINSEINGYWRHQTDAFGGAITLRHSIVQASDVSFPVDVRAPGNGVDGPMRYEFFGNYRYAATNDWRSMPDRRGTSTWMQNIETRQDTYSSAWNASTERIESGQIFPSVRAMALGAQTLGKNFRDNATFATAATVGYTFKRNLTVSTVAGSNTLTATSGTFKPSDVGKRAVIVNGTSDCTSAPGDVIGFIKSYTNSTTAVFGAGGHVNGDNCRANLSTAGGFTLTLGEDEPDANYFVVGLACSADERFSWSAIATTGFTITSSNASSTATCNFLIVR